MQVIGGKKRKGNGRLVGIKPFYYQLDKLTLSLTSKTTKEKNIGRKVGV